MSQVPLEWAPEATELWWWDTHILFHMAHRAHVVGQHFQTLSPASITHSCLSFVNPHLPPILTCCCGMCECIIRCESNYSLRPMWSVAKNPPSLPSGHWQDKTSDHIRECTEEPLILLMPTFKGHNINIGTWALRELSTYFSCIKIMLYFNKHWCVG